MGMGLYIIYESMDLGGLAGCVGMIAGPLIFLLMCVRLLIIGV